MARRVFVVDDSDELRRLIGLAIRESGQFAIVGEAAEAEAAIDGVRRLRPDVLIVDLQLKEGSGWEVIQAVGDLARHTLILTNSASPMHRAEAEARGVTYFFDKTTQFDEFLECLAGLA